MRLSLNVSGIGPLAEWMKLAIQCETAGWDGVWFSEHAGFHDAVVPAAIIASQTRKIEVGVMGATPTTRHPVILAMELATLAEMYPDRIRLQIGTGDAALMAPLGGIPRKPLGAIQSLLDSQRALLAGQKYTGTVGGHEMNNATLYVGPKKVAIDILAIRPKMLDLAAREGDGVALSAGASLGYLSGVCQHIRETYATENSQAKSFRITAAVIASVSHDIDLALQSARKMLSAWSPEILTILAPDIDLKSAGLVKDWPADLLHKFAFIATPKTYAARLAEFAATGIDELAMGFVNPPEEIAACLPGLLKARDTLS